MVAVFITRYFYTLSLYGAHVRLLGRCLLNQGWFMIYISIRIKYLKHLVISKIKKKLKHSTNIYNITIESIEMLVSLSYFIFFSLINVIPIFHVSDRTSPKKSFLSYVLFLFYWKAVN